MVRAWLFNQADTSDQRALHQHYPNQPVTLEQLQLLGINYWYVSDYNKAVEAPNAGLLGEVRQQRGYKNHDVVDISPTTLPNYEDKLKIFFNEHLHEDEEIRLLLAGSGFFDLRDELNILQHQTVADEEQWIRIHVFPGDMIVLPAGSYHRFTMDEKNYAKAMRLFKDAPKWEALNRSGDVANGTSSRKEYLDYLHKQQSTVEQQSKSASEQHVTEVTTKNNGTSYTLSYAAQGLANYPHMRAYNGLLYVSGLSSRRLDGTHRGVTYNPDKTVKELHIAEQTAAVLDNIESILRVVGADLTNVIDTTCFLTDMSNYKQFNEVYNQYFVDGTQGPTRTTIAVKQLPHPNLLIEIKAVAVDPRVNKQQ